LVAEIASLVVLVSPVSMHVPPSGYFVPTTLATGGMSDSTMASWVWDIASATWRERAKPAGIDQVFACRGGPVERVRVHEQERPLIGVMADDPVVMSMGFGAMPQPSGPGRR